MTIIVTVMPEQMNRTHMVKYIWGEPTIYIAPGSTVSISFLNKDDETSVVDVGFDLDSELIFGGLVGKADIASVTIEEEEFSLVFDGKITGIHLGSVDTGT